MAGVGAQLFQPPVTLVNTMNGWTQKYFQPILADSIFRPSPTYWRITRLGKKIDGGGGLVWSVITTEETTGGSYYGVQVLDTSITDSDHERCDPLALPLSAPCNAAAGWPRASAGPQLGGNSFGQNLPPISLTMSEACCPSGYATRMWSSRPSSNIFSTSIAPLSKRLTAAV